MNDKLVEFCRVHRICILDTNKRTYRYMKMNVQYFKDPEDFNKVYDHRSVVDSEPLYTIEISESELLRLAEFESEVFNHMQNDGHYNLFRIFMEHKEQEQYLKNKYPAVKKAYEHYSLMLKLAESGEL